MSYLFDANGEYLSGSFTSNYGHPLTVAAWVKKTGAQWGSNNGGILQLTEAALNRDDGIRFGQAGDADDTINAIIRTSGGSQGRATLTFTANAYDDTWVLIVGRWTGDDTVNARDIYIEDSGNTTNNTANRAITGTLDQILVGNENDGTSLFLDGLLAEVCIWDMALSTTDIDALQTGVGQGPAPNTIQSANVIGYWPLSADNATQSNLGSDAGGDLTVTNATYDADHPTIGGGAVVSISDAGDEVYKVGDSVTITGSQFEAVQGTGRVVISPTDDIDDVNAEEQTVTSWGDTSIDITVVRGTLAFGNSMFLFVENDSAESNASGYSVQYEPIVRITDTLEDEDGNVIVSETGISALIWRNKAPVLTADELVTGISTDGSGNFTVDIANTGLADGDPVYFIPFKDHPTTWAIGAIKLVPSYL